MHGSCSTYPFRRWRSIGAQCWRLLPTLSLAACDGIGASTNDDRVRLHRRCLIPRIEHAPALIFDPSSAMRRVGLEHGNGQIP